MGVQADVPFLDVCVAAKPVFCRISMTGSDLIDCPAVKRPRQLRLFHLENPLTSRFGQAFFCGLPQVPGVYFFYDAQERLLYIGQSSDLRARLGSYRHVTEERHSRRTLRLVARVVRIEWWECSSAAEAIREESLLLLEHRPPFNRAGVWIGDPWWLSSSVSDGALELCLSHEESPGCTGPMPASFRHSLPALIRCWLRIEHPDWSLAHFPCGFMNGVLALEISVPACCPEQLQGWLVLACDGHVEDMLAALDALPAPVTHTEQEFWREERTKVERLAARMARGARMPAAPM